MARLLSASLPRLEVLAFSELGHMAPITHADVVNQAIAAFLARLGAP
ncbi:hypothetical protein [Pseudomonas sp. N040]|nr:hypothetical protein [Pseudomonas sp. N040]MBF7731548.1 hypothetical protein [Pseudomonas sp. N040]MBW7015192.1 hypothetical protein [Pseudomonas sp. N040]